MASYDNSLSVGKDIIFHYIKKRMKEKKITQKKLSELIGVDESTLIRNFKKGTDKGGSEMLLKTYLKICKVLELNPHPLPKDIDKNDFENMFFN